MSERKFPIKTMKNWVNKNKKVFSIISEHPEAVIDGMEILIQQSSYDIMLMKDPEYLKEARKLNEEFEFDNKIEALKRKYIAKYIHEGWL